MIAKVNPVSAHEKAKLLSQSQMKKTAPTSMNRERETGKLEGNV